MEYDYADHIQNTACFTMKWYDISLRDETYTICFMGVFRCIFSSYVLIVFLILVYYTCKNVYLELYQCFNQAVLPKHYC